MRAAFLDRHSLDRDDLDLSGLRALLPDLILHPSTAPDQVPERIADRELVIANKVPLSAPALRQAPDLKLICVPATGLNHIDFDTTRARGITVCNARGYGTSSVAQHVMGLILALSTHLLEYRQAVLRGDWGRTPQFCLLDHPIRELDGLTLGIVGHGELGQAVGRLGAAFGMRVLVAARPGAGAAPAGRIPLTELLPQVDVLSLHCPLTEATRNLIGAAALAAMKPTALLINTARGGIVDEAALADALRTGVIGGAGIDVLTEEPPVHGNVLIDPGLPNLIVTPHNAWGSREARQRLVTQSIENIRGFMSGAPIRVVDS